MAAFVRGCGLAVIATVDPAGRPEAALVGIAALADGTLVFDALSDSRKIRNLTADPAVAVVVGWSDQVSLQLEGSAVITSGAERSYYAAQYVAQFPGARATQEKFAVVTIRPTWLRSYDSRTEPPVIDEARWGPVD